MLFTQRNILTLFLLGMAFLSSGCGMVWARMADINQPVSTEFSATWINGSTLAFQPAVYGTKGVPSTANSPGSRKMSKMWADSAGNFWQFGGGYVDASPLWHWYGDLWKYTPSDNTWTWVSGTGVNKQAGVYGTRGVANSANLPGARFNYLSWTDASGNFWIFGGNNGLPGYLNDLWKYNPTTNLWTWMNGSSSGNDPGTYGTQGVGSTANSPSARGDYFPASTWVDSSGNFWLYGGAGVDITGVQKSLSDIWKYNPTTNEWTWMSGSKTGATSPVFGSLGVPSTANTPGSRGGSAYWLDSYGNLWIYGGGSYDSGFRGGSGYFNLNDLWKFNPTTLQWTWLGGSTTADYASGAVDAVYGMQGVPSTSNSPGSRSGSFYWTDHSGQFWLLGGATDSTLWKLDPSTLQWTWVSGNPGANQPGIYGTQGVSSPTNIWGGSVNGGGNLVDGFGHFWLFGGTACDSAGVYGDLSTLWMFNP